MIAQAQQLIDAARRRGAARADVFIKTGSTRRVTRDASGNVAWTRTAEGGLGLRVFTEDGGRGFASSCGASFTAAAADQLAAAALDTCRGGGTSFDLPAPGSHGAAGRAPDARGLGIFDPRLHTATPADLEGILDEIVEEALRADPRARRLDTASLSASSSEVTLANSSGLAGGYRQTLVHVSLGLSASDGARHSVLRRSRSARTLSSLSPRLFGDESARLTALLLEGRPPAAAGAPAVLSPSAAVTLLRALSRQLLECRGERAGAVHLGKLSIVDDGRLPGGIATSPFDGEGSPTRRTPIVTHGAVAGALHDLESAARAGAATTGNGVRTSFREPPRLQPTNFFIAPGGGSPQELLERLGAGVWIRMLRPTPALATDASLFCGLASGFVVRAGEPAEPFGGALVSGDLWGMLAGTMAAGNDLTFGFPGDAFGAPSLLLERVSLRPA